MNNQTKTINIQAQFFALLGPILIACTMLIMAIRQTPIPWGIAAAALGGILLCYQWQWRGVLLSLVFLLGAFAYHIHAVQYVDWAWLTVLSASIAAAFIVSALALEEFCYSLAVLQKDLQEQKELISSYKDSHQQSQRLFTSQQSSLEVKINQLEDEIKLRDERALTTDRLIGIAKSDLVASSHNREKLLNELLQARQKVIEVELLITKEPKTEELKDKNSQLQEQLSDLNEELLKLQKENNKLHTSIQSNVEKLQDSENKFKSYEKVLSDSEKAFSDSEKALSESNKDFQEYVTMSTGEIENLKTTLAELQSGFNNEKKCLQQLLDEKEEKQKAEMQSLIEKQSLEVSELQSRIEKFQIALPVIIPSEEGREGSARDDSASSVELNREVKKLKGLYEQLRIQFSEKSLTLDNTRKELFQAQEKYDAQHKHFEETKLNMEKEHSRHITDLLANTENELALIEQQENEIKQLNELVSALVK